MSGKKFLYGTHYSAPGYVLYYLVRTGKPLYNQLICDYNFIIVIIIIIIVIIIIVIIIVI